MNEGRFNHGLIKQGSRIYAFAGNWPGPAKRCEYHDLVNDTWTNIQNELPDGMTKVICTFHQSLIYLASADRSDIYIFDPKTEIFNNINLNFSEPFNMNPKIILSYRGKLLIIWQRCIHVYANERLQCVQKSKSSLEFSFVPYNYIRHDDSYYFMDNQFKFIKVNPDTYDVSVEDLGARVPSLRR